MGNKEKSKPRKKGLIWKILTPVFAVILIVCIVAIPITQGYTGLISNAPARPDPEDRGRSRRENLLLDGL